MATLRAHGTIHPEESVVSRPGTRIAPPRFKSLSKLLAYTVYQNHLLGEIHNIFQLLVFHRNVAIYVKTVTWGAAALLVKWR